MEDKFGAGYKHTEHGGKIIFSLDRLQKIQKSYDLEVKIKTRIKKTDSTDSTDGYMEKEGTSEDNISHEDIEISQDIDQDNVNIPQNQGSERVQIPPTLPQEPSGLSEPSGLIGLQPSPTAETSSEETKAARLREYERISALSRKKSREAAKIRIEGKD